jgi:hypothetical protein
MLLTKQALNAALFASTDETRLALNHVKVDPSGTVWASNGYTAVRVDQGAEIIADADYPIAGNIPDEAKDPSVPVLIPAEVALRVAKVIPRRPNIPVLGRALLRVTDTTVYLLVNDLDHAPTVVQFKRSDERYPAIEAVYPAADKPAVAAPFGISATYLALVSKLESLFDGGRNRPVKVTSYGPDAPISFQWGGEYGGLSAHVIVMPVRL